MSYPWSLINTQNLDIQSNLQLNTNSGNDGEVVYKESGTQTWKKINGILAKYTDRTNGSQNVCGGLMSISFSDEIFNTAGINFGGNNFKFERAGYYLVNFQCLLSNSDSQCNITFTINSVPYYSNCSVFTSGSSNPVPFYMSTIIPIIDGDVLEITSEKINSGPSFLITNPVNNLAVTQLLIKKL